MSFWLSIRLAVSERFAPLIARFATGQDPNTAALIGWNRFVGIVLFENGCPVAGSVAGLLRIPSRSLSVGTEARRVVPIFERPPSYAAKKNVLSFLIGPPKVAPN